MSSIEKIVRPFQTGDVFRARRLPYSEEDPNLQINFKVEWEEDRGKRESKRMKVVNPDDEDQKVFIERVDKFVFKDKMTGKEQSFKFDWSQSLDNATPA
jgi:hypothetical protein